MTLVCSYRPYRSATRDNSFVSLRVGKEINVGPLVYQPPRSGPTLWEIGVPDRTAAEFNIPDPDPALLTKLYINHSTAPEDR